MDKIELDGKIVYKPVSFGDSKKEKILFVHMNQLGDLLFSLPVLASARKQWGDKKLFSFVRPQYVPLLKCTGFVDEIIPRPSNDAGSAWEILRTFRKEKFDKAVLFSESPETHLLSFVASIPDKYGFESASFSFLVNHTVKRIGVPSLENNRRLGESMGLKDIPEDYTGLIKISDEEIARCSEWLKAQSLHGENIVVIAPGASLRRREKFWSMDKWTGVIDYLNKNGYKTVLVGAWSELIDLKIISENASFPSVVFAPHNDIIAVASLIKAAKLFMGIDSGAMHLAAALDVPVVALFGTTDPAQVGPRPLAKHTVVKKSMMDYIRLEDVIGTLETILRKWKKN